MVIVLECLHHNNTHCHGSDDNDEVAAGNCHNAGRKVMAMTMMTAVMRWCHGPGRLEDKAAIVRKAALQLLGSLMHSNPFAPVLAHSAFEASLNDFQAKLQACVPVPSKISLAMQTTNAPRAP